MKNHLKIIRMLYSPHLITEALLAAELILTVLILSLYTNSASYLLRQIQVCDKYWGKEQYLYFTISPSAQIPLDPQEVLQEYAEVSEIYCSMPESRGLTDNKLSKEDGTRPRIILLRYNTSMVAKAAEILDIREDLDPGKTTPICVSKALEKVYPLGSVLRLSQYVPDEGPKEQEYTVCGIIREEQIPAVGSASSMKTTENLTMNIQEQFDNNTLVIISIEEDITPITAGMFRVKEGADCDALSKELSNRFVNSGDFCSYASMRAASKDWALPVNTSLLLQAFLLSLVFVSHFIGYLAVYTHNKERTNALLSINGMSPAKLAVYNACSVLYILIPSIFIGILLIPLGEKRYPILKAYGGYIVLWQCLAVFSIIALLSVCLTVYVRLKKGNTILLYRKGT